VISIELSPEAVLDAVENAKENGIENITFVQGDVGRELNRLRLEPDFVAPDVVLLDPPRVGLDPQAMDCLLQLMPKKIVYISCNPKTQVVNIEQFVQNGYRLVAMQAVDQFPHTLHIENIAILVI
jgi:23S rRNA (uracil1939-C5)-methyltransferase